MTVILVPKTHSRRNCQSSGSYLRVAEQIGNISWAMGLLPNRTRAPHLHPVHPLSLGPMILQMRYVEAGWEANVLQACERYWNAEMCVLTILETSVSSSVFGAIFEMQIGLGEVGEIEVVFEFFSWIAFWGVRLCVWWMVFSWVSSVSFSS
jgi:hypothetical protein